MKWQTIFSCLLNVFATASCKKDDSESPKGPGPEPVKTEKGVAIGAPVTKVIGSGGGELSSADGQVKITVPSGAVAVPTEFTIQPITNTLHKNEAGRNAYRLLPEGNNFAKPVKVSFSYTAGNWNGSSEDLLTVQFQQSDGSWTRVPASLNKATKTLEVATTHFSDWLVGSAFEIMGESIVTAGQSSTLHVFGVYDNDDLNAVAPLLDKGWDGKVTSVGNWRLLSGPGSLSAVANDPGPVYYQRKYTAPMAITTVQKAEVAVTVRGMISIPDSSAPGGKRIFREVTLIKELTIVPANYITGTFGSTQINHTDVLYTTGQGFEISSQNGVESIAFKINAPPGTGAFPSGDFITADGKSKTTLTMPGGLFGVMFYASEYVSCDDPANPIKYAGVIRINEFGPIGQPIRGTFEGTLYRLTQSGSGSACPQYENFPVSLQFGTIRTM